MPCINMKEVPRRRNEGTKLTNEHGGCGAVGCHSSPVSLIFYYLSYGMELYINDSIPTNTNIEQMYVYASELRKCWHFYILKLLFLSIFCRYIENKPWLNFIWGGGQARPPPPHQYASGMQWLGSVMWLVQAKGKAKLNVKAFKIKV